MKEIILNRILDDGERTLGILKVPDLQFKLFTLERSWKENKNYVSCIPCGEYIVKPNYISANFGKKSFLVEGVKGRDKILIHAGNRVKESKGCILVGRFFTLLEGERAITQSALAIQDLKSIFKEDFKLIIKKLNYK
jgi:hypothetical protein